MRRDLAAKFMRRRSKQTLDAAIAKWLRQHEVEVNRFNDMVEEMKVHGPVDIATLLVAAQELRILISN